MTVSDLFELIGRKTIQDTLQVSKQTVSTHEGAGKIPANWRDVFEKLCEPKGIDIRSDEFKDLFNMKKAVG